jgi:hypothetical protein
MPDSISLPAIAYAIDGDDVAAELTAKRIRLEETEIELQGVKDGGYALAQAVEASVRAYAERHGCEWETVMDAISEQISSLIWDAEGTAARRKTRLEDEITALEDLL